MDKFKNGQYYDAATIKKFVENACTSISTKGIDEKTAKAVGMSKKHIHQFEMSQFLSNTLFTLELLSLLFEDEDEEKED